MTSNYYQKLTANQDEEFGDGFVDVNTSYKRMVRATVKTYDQTGTYVFLKLFKRNPQTDQLEKNQFMTLSLPEWEALYACKFSIDEAVARSQSNMVNPPSMTKTPVTVCKRGDLPATPAAPKPAKRKRVNTVVEPEADPAAEKIISAKNATTTRAAKDLPERLFDQFFAPKLQRQNAVAAYRDTVTDPANGEQQQQQQCDPEQVPVELFDDNWGDGECSQMAS